MSTAIKTIIFDFGNVVGLFDYSPTFAKLRALTALSEEEIRAALRASKLPDAFECGHINADQFLESVIAMCRLHPDCDRAFLAYAWSDIFTPNRVICDLIPRLKPHYRLLLGSNTNELHARQFRSQFADVLRHFDNLVLSYEIKAMKPDVRFFRHCHELADCEAAECLFIDDMSINVEAARSYGLQGIVYESGSDLTVMLADLQIRLTDCRS
jgi:putative hydrolase of the HAD superfamily